MLRQCIHVQVSVLWLFLRECLYMFVNEGAIVRRSLFDTRFKYRKKKMQIHKKFNLKKKDSNDLIMVNECDMHIADDEK